MKWSKAKDGSDVHQEFPGLDLRAKEAEAGHQYPVLYWFLGPALTLTLASAAIFGRATQWRNSLQKAEPRHSRRSVRIGQSALTRHHLG